MTQKKNEQKKNEQKEQEYLSDSIVNTIWNQYEGALQRSRKLRENRYEAYIKALQESTKFSSEYRNTLKTFYEETKKTNADVINQIQPKNSEEKFLQKRQELRDQWKNVGNQWESLFLTPIKSSFDVAEKLEKRAIENSKTYLENLQKSSKERSAASDEYIKLARDTHQKFVRRVEDSVKVLVSVGDK
jgi:hypothetical protein